MRDYVEHRNGGYYLAGTRIPLEGIVYQFRQGTSAEGIRQGLPSLTLEQIYGAITFYLANQEDVDLYVHETEKFTDQSRAASQSLPSDLRERLNRARSEMHLKRS
jgi:uncharacterized protein (DUF433 family)